MGKPLIIITGASSGIGEAAARLLSAAGHPLLLLARRVDRLQALDLPNTLSRRVDITDRPTLLAAVAEAEAQFGPADALINNAGVMLLGEMKAAGPGTVGPDARRQCEEPAQWRARGGGRDDRAQTRHDHQRVSSVAGRKTFPNHVAYVGTKFAVHGLSENLREELSPHNVRVITIAPNRRNRTARPHHR